MYVDVNVKDTSVDSIWPRVSIRCVRVYPDDLSPQKLQNTQHYIIHVAKPARFRLFGVV